MREIMNRYDAETSNNKGIGVRDYYTGYIAWLEAQLTWRPVSEKPEKDQIVIATYLNSYGKRRRVRAVYVRQYEEEAGDDDELCVEYCHEKDEWYLKEGWYELIDNWDYSSAAIVEGVVDYWMPMPPAPDTVSDGGGIL